MSFTEPKKPLFAVADNAADDETFEEDEDDLSEPQQTTVSASPSKPFSLFGGSFFSSTNAQSPSQLPATAGVVEGEEDEDEPSSPNYQDSTSLATPSSPNTISAATSGPSTSDSAAESASNSQTRQKKYSTAEKRVVDMNLAIRKAPVKKLKETFVQLRSELAPTQNSLTASVRAASEASAISALIDDQLSALSERFQSIKPIFSV